MFLLSECGTIEKEEKVSCTKKFRILHFSSITYFIYTRNINISVRENVENASIKKKKKKICHRFIIEIRAGSSIEFEIPKRYGGCDDAGQSN